ncbi:MAG TPA: zinc ribbon domain-containing protein [Phycisphaerales bacterium]|nr:zinc ribbon domain-containing protein [Phycisphaerales bacterium]
MSRPAVTILLAMLVAADVALTAPRSALLGEQSVHTATVDLAVVRTAQGPRVFDPEDESYGELVTLMNREPERVLLLEYFFREEVGGLWAPTRRWRADWLSLTPLVPGSFTPGELELARARARGYLHQHRLGPRWSLASVGASRREITGPVVLAWAHNALSLGLVVTLLVSTGWLWGLLARGPRLPGPLRRWRARQVCGACGFDLTRVPGRVCPECGARIRDRAGACPGRAVSGPDGPPA